MEVTPVLVVGHIRSGTKWLSNILCNHAAVAGVQSERARGILETNMFHRMQRKFDLRSPDDYIGFLEVWRKTEFLHQAGTDVDALYKLNPRPTCFIALFDRVMRDYAARTGARCWLQKCGPDQALDILPRLGPAKVVLIRRELLSVVQSLRNMTRNRDQSFSMLKAVPGIVRMERLMGRLEQNYDTCAVRYEDVKQEPGRSIGAVCAYLGIEYTEDMLTIPFRRNTSFDGARPEPLSSGHARILTLAQSAARALPMPVLERMLGVGNSPPPPLSLVSGTFGDLKNELADTTDY